jgi:drug/metabolite transporter (DMT)-like permease
LTLQGGGFLALGAAVSWGGGDFSGGMGVKSAGGSTRAALRFILLAHGISFFVLALVLELRHEALPAGAPLLWGLFAGVAGGLSLTAFYMALSRGEMGISAAVSGLLAAAVPALVSLRLEGAPGALKLCGFAVAAVAIWLIAAGPNVDARTRDRSTFWLAVGGGAGFGIYFVALRMANTLGLVWPMALARAGSLTICGLLLLGIMAFRAGGAPQVVVRPALRVMITWAVGVAVLDTAGNMLFVAATRLGRLDAAAVLASLYPASTILLAAWRLHERPTRRQGMGMVAALAAVVLITL